MGILLITKSVPFIPGVVEQACFAHCSLSISFCVIPHSLFAIMPIKFCHFIAIRYNSGNLVTPAARDIQMNCTALLQAYHHSCRMPTFNTKEDFDSTGKYHARNFRKQYILTQHPPPKKKEDRES